MRHLTLFLVLLTSNVYAVDYYWTYDSGNFPQLDTPSSRFANPILACNRIEQLALQSYPVPISKNVSTPVKSGNIYKFTCTVKAGNTGGGTGTYTTVFARAGDACPPDTTFNPATGACEGDPCIPKKDQPQSVSKSGLKNDSFLRVTFNETLKKNFYFYSSTACFSGCSVDIARKLTCTVDTIGQYRCGGTGTFSGASCSSQVPSSDPDPTGNDPVPEEKTSDEPCIYGTGTDGVTSCTKRNKLESDGIFTDRPGDSDCGSTAGCNGKDPKSQEDKIETKITSKTNPDGTVETTKTDTKTVTKCTSIDTNCSTSTTTKTTTTKTDANGNVTGVSGKCTGSQCTSNTNPDGNGDGFGDCVGDDCGDEEEGGSTVAGESCDVALTCEGDAIQCAILRQEKENNCKWRLGAPEEAQIVAQLEGEGFELEENDVDTGSMFSDALAQGRWLSGSCPAPRTVNVMGTTLSFSWEPVCQFAISMGPLIVAMASLFFALYVFRGVKGS